MSQVKQNQEPRSLLISSNVTHITLSGMGIHVNKHLRGINVQKQIKTIFWEKEDVVTEGQGCGS